MNKSKKMLSIIMCSLIAALSFTSCGTAPAADDPLPSAAVSSASESNKNTEKKETQELPVITAEDKSANIEKLNYFTSELFKSITDKSKGENTLVSPLSVYMAFAMLNNGAAGSTQAEINDVLSGYIQRSDAEVDYASHNPLTADQLNAFMSGYLAEINGDDTIKIANSIFLMDRSDLTFNEGFQTTINSLYSADIFHGKADGDTVNRVNSWVDEKTNGMIPSIISEIKPDTVSILLNAIAFEGSWSEPYDPETDVYEDNFTCADGSVKSLSFMKSTESGYLSDDSAEGFMKMYSYDFEADNPMRFCFIGLLPNEGISVDEYIKTMTSDTIRNTFNNRNRENVIVNLPKFTFGKEYHLPKILYDMGMQSAFSANADFSQLAVSDNGGVYIGDVIHDTHIELNEKGTRAAAVTGITMFDNAVAVEEEPRVLTFDRPFVFAIYDMNNDVPIFIGTVCDPTLNK